MACEAELDAAAAAADAEADLKADNDLERQYMQYQEMAATGLTFGLWWLAQLCLMNQGPPMPLLAAKKMTKAEIFHVGHEQFLKSTMEERRRFYAWKKDRQSKHQL